jgi:hypothetical protein
MLVDHCEESVTNCSAGFADESRVVLSDDAV